MLTKKALATLSAMIMACGALSSLPAAAQTPAPPPANYASGANWLCLPGRADACAVDLSSTSVSASGGLRAQTFRPAANPKIDCFYVYPTVSLDAGEVSDLVPGAEERRAVAAQFARFTSACRPFAPVYRQVTATALRNSLEQGEGLPGRTQTTGYPDVLAAWRQYMARDNGGRGVVLIGQEQGAELLMRLLAEEIEGKPAQARLVSAILVGATVRTGAGRDTAGAFDTIPLCRAPTQTGCVITYSSYRDTAPPREGAWHGRNGERGVAACTNPANLKTGRGEPKSIFSAIVRGQALIADSPSWAGPEKPVGTPFVEVPGLIATTCASDTQGAWLSVHVNAKPDKRTDVINGDLMVGRRIQAEAGLNLIELELSLGNLVDIVQRQGRAYKPPRG